MVTTVNESVEKDVDGRVKDRLAGLVCFQMTFGNIGKGASVYQYLIPWFVLGRAAAGNLLIPFIGALKVSVDIQNYTPVVKFQVVHNLSDGKAGF